MNPTYIILAVAFAGVLYLIFRPKKTTTPTEVSGNTQVGDGHPHLRDTQDKL